MNANRNTSPQNMKSGPGASPAESVVPVETSTTTAGVRSPVRRETSPGPTGSSVDPSNKRMLDAARSPASIALAVTLANAKLDDVMEFCRDQADVDDGQPNEAMRCVVALSDVQATLERIVRVTKAVQS